MNPGVGECKGRVSLRQKCRLVLFVSPEQLIKYSFMKITMVVSTKKS